MKKLRVGILFGGRSGEHEVSLLSAASVLQAMDQSKYDVHLIGITKDGRWLTANDAAAFAAVFHWRAATFARRRSRGNSRRCATGTWQRSDGAARSFIRRTYRQRAGHLRTSAEKSLNVDVIFPVLHGTFGEDGTVQGLLELADIAYVGSGVLGSSAGMDKDVMKRLFAAASCPSQSTSHCCAATGAESSPRPCSASRAALRYPMFVKPANLGSSVGISKAHDRKELAVAIDLAASYDRKIVIETGHRRQARKSPRTGSRRAGQRLARSLGRRRSHSRARSFTITKPSISSEGSQLIIPAKLTKAETKRVQQMAIDAFRACDLSGMARVDFLMEPGISTAASAENLPERGQHAARDLLPSACIPSYGRPAGCPYKQLIDRLIQLALERHEEKKSNRYDL